MLSRPALRAMEQEHSDPRSTELKQDGNLNNFDWSGSWVWESSGASLSIVGIALLIGFLVYIHDTPYASWQYTAAPNTVVSIIITITKAALLVPVSSCLSQLKWNLYRNPARLYHMQAIDQASRGALGSLEILWRALFCSNMGSLTIVGASITILAIAIDPFAQQVLSFPSRTVPALNVTASVQKAQEYFSVMGAFGDHVYYGLSPTMMTSILSGLAQTTQPLEPHCPSSSCSYPDFVTLGICSRCEDVTSQTAQTCQPEPNATWFTGESPIYKKISANCTYESPNGFELNIPFDEAVGMFTNYPRQTYDINYWTSLPRTNSSVFNIEDPIVSFLTANYSLSLVYTPENVTSPPPKPSFQECTVYYCEKQYPTSSFQTNIQKNRSLHHTNTQQLIRQKAGRWSYAMSDIYHLTPPNGRVTLSQNSTYNIDEYTLQTLGTVLTNLFNTTLSTRSPGSQYSALDMATILRTGNLSQSLGSMSTSITNMIRTNPRATAVPGEAYRVETYIQVRWPWIILPICAVLGSILLLLGTALANKQQGAVLWKDSVLPLLMGRLDIAAESEIGSLRNVDEVQRVLKKIDVVMDDDGGHLVFTERKNAT